MPCGCSLPLIALIVAVLTVAVLFAKSQSEKKKIAQRTEDGATDLPGKGREGTVFSRWGGLYAVLWALAIVLVAGSLYVLFSCKYGAETQRYAFGIVGLTAGYWLGSR